MARSVPLGTTLLERVALGRSHFLRAVALAAGRTVEPSNPAFSDMAIEARDAPDRKTAIANNQLILVAEDNNINQKVIRRQLELLGYTADIAENGRLALSWWRHGEYALVLTDFHMPEMDGYELTEAIRKEEDGAQRIPIFALTANAVKGEGNHSCGDGMDGYLVKPIALDALEAVLRGWIAQACRPLIGNGNATDKSDAQQLALLNIEVLRDLIGDDTALITEFLTDFKASAAKEISLVFAAAESADLTALRHITHRLKSSSRAIGALSLGDVCERLEDGENRQRVGDIGALTQEFRKIASEVLDVIDSELARSLSMVAN
ncbi:MAG: two-component system sensor histidine kinase/response regulator [Gammaproteobacteria bacterium]|jgi:two-component system sensor histidine kinase/response regulator